jgi:long-chain acyl-CoA synthetase
MTETIPDPAAYRGVLELLRFHAERNPDRIFLRSIDQDLAMSWREMYQWSNRIARFLTARGIGANDRILVLTENSLENLVLYFAILRHGATYCAINVEVNSAHLSEMIARLKPSLVLVQDGLEIEKSGDSDWIGFGAPGDDGGLFTMAAEWPDTADIPEPPCLASADDFAVISFTSGTSAAPKGVMHQYGNYFWIAQQTIDMWGITAADRVLEFRSLSWASSHMLCLMPCLVAGAEIVLAKRFSRRRFFGWIAAHRPSVVIGVPTVVNMLLEHAGDSESPGDFDFSSLRFMTCSTAPLMVEQHRRFEAAYGIRLVQIYGMSEGGVVAGNHHDARRIGSVGPPGLYQNLKILGPEGEVGEIEIGGAQTAYGYLMADGTVEKIRGTRLKTGDLGYLDADGYLHVTGRAKDVIIRGGVNIAPLEIDNALTAHPDIAEAATIGVPDPVYGETPVSYIVCAAGRAVGEETALDHCRGLLDDFKLPVRIVVMDEIPKNDRGKTDRGALIADWKARQANPPSG